MTFIEKRLVLAMDPDDLSYATEYHQGPAPARVDLIAAQWDDERAGIVTANRRDDGKIVVIDGVQRVEAARRCDERLTVEIYMGLDLARETGLFVELNSKRPTDEATLIDRLGLKQFGSGPLVVQGDWLDLGTVTLHEADDEGPAVTIDVAVSRMPALFWRFTITRGNEGDDHRERPTETVVVETGSGPLTQYWPAAVLVAENSLTIKPATVAEPCVFCGEPVYGPAPYGPPYDDDGYRHDRCSEAHYRGRR